MALKKSKRGALLSSGLSIVLCTAMLVGGTLAWFTDNASTGVNTIKTGNLDVSLTKNGESIENKTNVFELEGGGEFLQPGQKITTGTMLVKNEGNLPFYYRINIIKDTTRTNNGVSLEDLMVVKVNGQEEDINTYKSYLEPGESHEVIVEIDMDNELENEYQNLTMENFKIEIEASQTELETHKVEADMDVKDLVDNILEQETVPANLVFDLSAKEEIDFSAISSNLSALVEKGAKEIIIEGNDAFSKSINNKTTVTFKGNGTDVIAAPNGATLTFRNVTIVDESTPYSGEAWEYCNLDMGGKLEFSNVTFNSGLMLESTEATFTGCTFNKIYGTDGKHKSNRYAAWVSNGNATFEECTFNSARSIKVHEAYGSKVGNVVVNNCTFKGWVKPAVAIGDVSNDVYVTITNNIINKNAITDGSTYYKQGIFESDTKEGDFTLIENNNN